MNKQVLWKEIELNSKASNDVLRFLSQPRNINEPLYPSVSLKAQSQN